VTEEEPREEEPEVFVENKVIRDRLWKSAKRAQALQVILVIFAAAAVLVSSTTAVFVGVGNRSYQKRIRDCTEPEGKCYQANQAATAKAVQAILDYIDDTMGPHRLRNEAENRCQVELFARKPTVLDKGSETALKEYDHCVKERSGGTEPPPLPENPLTTTTTTRE